MAPAQAMAKLDPPVQRPKLQYGVIPYRLGRAKDRIEIMLITSRNTRRWIVPKGWPIARTPARDVARREALEEAGLEGAMGQRPFGSFHYQKRRKDGSVVPCRVNVFAFEVERQRKEWLERSERKRRWFDAERAIKLVREQELKALIGALVRSLEEGKRAALGDDAQNPA
ncbi:MAG: NUDIX hydrolase [Stellaceae bacterium]